MKIDEITLPSTERTRLYHSMLLRIILIIALIALTVYLCLQKYADNTATNLVKILYYSFVGLVLTRITYSVYVLHMVASDVQATLLGIFKSYEIHETIKGYPEKVVYGRMMSLSDVCIIRGGGYLLVM